MKPLQTDTILTLIAFAAVWFLVSYIFYKIRKNYEPDDDRGVIKREELSYVVKFNKTIRAMIISFMYDDYKLHVKINTETKEKNAFLIRFDDIKPVDNHIVDMLVKFNKIVIDDVITPDGTFLTIIYKPTIFALLWCCFILLVNRSIVKTIKDLEYLRI